LSERLDLDYTAGEDEVLEVCPLEETIMRGLRRGRNKPSPEDVQESSPEAKQSAPGAGSVTLVETPPPPSPEGSEPPGPPPAAQSTEPPATARPAAETPVSPAPARVTSGGQTRLRDTISQVATAHAELDNVLPPSSDNRHPRPLRKDSGKVTISAPVASSINEEPVVHDARPSEMEETAGTPAEPVRVENGTLSAPSLPVDEAVTVNEDQNEQVEEKTEAPSEALSEEQSSAPVDVQSASANPLPRVLAVANQKGGVGKTTTSVNLGAALAELGFRVLVIDLDPQGNATTGLGIDARNFELSMYDVLMRDASLEDCVEPTSMKNLFVAPATIALAGAEIELVPAFSRELKLKRSIQSVIDDFDYVLIDCPPSLGLITVNALAAADEVLVPIQCEYYALEGLSQLMRNVHLVGSNLNPNLDISTIVLTMYDARTKLADQVANEVRQHFGAKVCRNVIPRTVRLSEAPSFGQPITAFDPASRGAIAYRELAKEVSGGTS
jgi:chromosome partitioning protein